MTQPNSDPKALPAWEQGLITVLNADGMDSRQFTGPSWISLLNAGYYVHSRGNRPWEDSMGTADANEFTIYRRTASSFNVVDDAVHDAYWIIKGRVDWYVKSDEYSPHEHFWNEWWNHSNNILNAPPSPLPLDPQSFHTAAESFYNLAMWLEATTQRLQGEVNKIDTHGSGFQGSAAQAFQQTLANLRDEMKLLREDLKTTSDWVQLLHDNGDAATEFWNQVRQAWSDFSSHPEYQPSSMVAKVMQAIEHAIDALGQHTNGWNKQAWNDGSLVVWQNLKTWPINIDFGNGSKSYDFRDPGNAISQLNADMHSYFMSKVAPLHEKMAQQYQKLRDSFERSYQNMSDLRNYLPPPPPTPDLNTGGGGGGGDGKGGPNLDDILNKGGGGDGKNGINLDDILNKGGGGGGGGGKGGPNFDDLLRGGGGGGGIGGGIGGGSGGGTGGGTGGGIGGTGGPDFSDLLRTGGGNGFGGLDGDGGGSGAGGGADLGGAGGLTGLLNGPKFTNNGKNPDDVKSGGVAGGADGTDFDEDPSPIDHLPGAGGPTASGSFPGLGGATGPGAGGSFPGLDDSHNEPGTGGASPGLGGGNGAGGSFPGLGGGSGAGGSFPGLGGGSGAGGSFPGLGGGSGAGGSFPGLGGGSGADGSFAGLGGSSSGDFSGIGGAGSEGHDFFGGSSGSDDGAFSGLGSSGGGLTGGNNGAASPNGMQLGPMGPAPAGGGGSGLNDLLGYGPHGADDTDAASAMGGLGGMPMMPPMGGMGGGTEKDDGRERTTWLAEEEEVWGTDPDVAPAVIGRDDVSDGSGRDSEPWAPTAPQRPGSPSSPARGTGRQTSRGR